MRPLYAVALMSGALPAHAASPFDGTWIWDASSTELPSEPDIYVLQKDRFRCQSCPVPYEVATDGVAHKVPGQSKFDALAVTVVSPSVTQLRFSKGADVALETTFTVSADGRELVTSTKEFVAGASTETRLVSQRIAGGEAGAHALSGAWRQIRIDSASENATLVTLKVTRSSITFQDPTGFFYNARFDGKEYPVQGAGAGRSVVVKRIDTHSFEETQKQDGKTVSAIRLTVAADGKTANYIFNDLVENKISRGRLTKQQATKSEANHKRGNP